MNFRRVKYDVERESYDVSRRQMVKQSFKVEGFFHEWTLTKNGVYAIVENHNGLIDLVSRQRIEFIDKIQPATSPDAFSCAFDSSSSVNTPDEPKGKEDPKESQGDYEQTIKLTSDDLAFLLSSLVYGEHDDRLEEITSKMSVEIEELIEYFLENTQIIEIKGRKVSKTYENNDF